MGRWPKTTTTMMVCMVLGWIFLWIFLDAVGQWRVQNMRWSIAADLRPKWGGWLDVLSSMCVLKTPDPSSMTVPPAIKNNAHGPPPSLEGSKPTWTPVCVVSLEYADTISNEESSWCTDLPPVRNGIKRWKRGWTHIKEGLQSHCWLRLGRPKSNWRETVEEERKFLGKPWVLKQISANRKWWRVVIFTRLTPQRGE